MRRQRSNNRRQRDERDNPADHKSAECWMMIHVITFIQIARSRITARLFRKSPRRIARRHRKNHASCLLALKARFAIYYINNARSSLTTS
jgi:hypothetical protein